MKKPTTRAAKLFKMNVAALVVSLDYFTKNKASIHPIKNLFLGGLISKVFAEFENFVSDSIAENLTSLTQRKVALSKLPREIRASLLYNALNHDHFRNFYASADEFRFINNLDTQFQAKCFSWDGNVSYPITYRDIIRTQSYPSKDNLEAVYGRLGLHNIFCMLNRELKRDTNAILASANSIRCGFVHDSQDPTLSIKDLKRIIVDLVSVAMVLDAITFKWINSIS